MHSAMAITGSAFITVMLAGVVESIARPKQGIDAPGASILRYCAVWLWTAGGNAGKLTRFIFIRRNGRL